MRMQLDTLSKAVSKLQQRTKAGQKISGQEFADEVNAVAVATQAAISEMAKLLDKLDRQVDRPLLPSERAERLKR